MSPTVSVLMPAYNAERYIGEAVESILSQTYTDFEFLIIDDGSTDGTRAILERFAARDSRIRFWSRPNAGIVVALNELISEARGELLARMDADDIAMPERFELQLRFLQEHPEVAVVGGAAQNIDSAGRPLNRIRFLLEDAEIQEFALGGRCSILHPSAMMRRDAVQAVGGYRAEAQTVEDLDLWLRLGERGRLANLEHVLIKYRIHDQSECHRHQNKQLALARLIANEACDRRGIERREFSLIAFRPDGSRVSRYETWVKYGWWGFNEGHRETALHYAWRAIGLIPWRQDGWRLMACAVLKSPRRT